MRKNSIFAVLAVLSLSLAACAGGTTETGNNKGGSDNAKEEVIKATEELVILEGVTTIEAKAYKGNKKLRKVVIPEGVTSIGKEAFADCEGLEEVIIPEGVLYIHEDAFDGCKSLTDVVIPDSVTYIGDGAFCSCSSLKKVIIPGSVGSINVYTFGNCTSLEEVIIPEGITRIKEGAFNGCTSLTNVVIPDGVTSIDYVAFKGCENLTNIVIPNSVTSIGYAAFDGCTKLTEVALPAGVALEEKAFEESVVITGEAAVTLDNEDKIEELALREIYKAIKLSSISYTDDEGKEVVKSNISLAHINDLMEQYAPKYKIMTQDGEVKTASYMTSYLTDFYEATSDHNAWGYNWINIPQTNGGTFSVGVSIWEDLSKSNIAYINKWLRGIITGIDKAKDMEVQWEEPVTNPTETTEGELSEVVIRSSHDMDGRILDENLSVSELMDRVPSGACITSVNRREGYIELRFEAGRKITVYDTNNGTSQEQWNEFLIWAEACERALEVLNTLK